MKTRCHEIIPVVELNGSTVAYSSGYYILVSPAVYSCMSDPSIKHIVMEQVKVKPLSQLVDSEVQNVSDKRVQSVLD